MFKRLTSSFAVLAVSLVALMVSGSGPAHAGIIVTVGKPAPEDASKRLKPGVTLSAPERGASPSGPCSAESTPQDKSAQSCNQKIDPATGLPADWKCVPIGGGLLYCEGPGAGAAADEGGAGSWDPDAEDYEDFEDEGYDAGGDEIEAFGCAAGNAAGGVLGAVSVLAALFMMVRGRRR